MRKFIDILEIVLPLLIIILGIIRVFVPKGKGLNGFTIFFAFLLLFAGLIRYYILPGTGNSADHGPKPPPLSVSKHSAAFNQSVDNVLSAYYKMSEDFAAGGLPAIEEQGAVLKIALDSLKIDELKSDSLIYETALQPYQNAKAEIISIISDPAINEKRGSLNIFSNELFALLSTIRYDQSVLFWLECDIAFGPEKPGNWLSNKEDASNPYGQPDCRDIKTKINFVTADSTKIK